MATGSSLLHRLSSSQWAVRPEFLLAMERVLTDKFVNNFDVKEMTQLTQLLAGDAKEKPTTLGRQVGKRWVVSIDGAMVPKASMLDSLCGMVGCNQIQAAINEGLNTSGIKEFVFEWDSPGGAIDGVPALAKKIKSLSKDYITTSFINNNMYSAAYLAGSAADRILANDEMCGVGSIGVYCLHVDQSKRDEQNGLKFTYIQAGAYKTFGNPHEPLTGAANAELQASVNETYEYFLNVVATNRILTMSKTMSVADGKTFSAQEGLKNGLIDGIIDFESFLNDPEE